MQGVSKSVQNKFHKGIKSIFDYLQSSEIYYYPIDLQQVDFDTSIYLENPFKKSLEPIVLSGGVKFYTMTRTQRTYSPNLNNAVDVIPNFESSIFIPFESMKNLISVVPYPELPLFNYLNIDFLVKGRFVHKEVVHSVVSVEPKGLFKDEYSIYRFDCSILKERVV